MLTIVSGLFEKLNEQDIRYCHWKSNESLEEALKGKGDLDILVDRRSADAFVSLIEYLGFKNAVDKGKKEPDSISHYYGMDAASGCIVHLHVYFRLITGGTLLKNYWLPLEEMLLNSTENLGVVKIPSKTAEFVLLVLRKALEHGALWEIPFFYREYDRIQREIDWLGGEDGIESTARLIEHWLPSVDKELFSACARELMPGGSFIKRITLGRKLRARLRNYSIYNPAKGLLMAGASLSRKVLRKLSARNGKALGRGVVIAIVGPEAVGKSTLQAGLKKWLEGYLWVEAVHAGRPPSTAATFLPNLAMPLARKLLPSLRTSRLRQEVSSKEREPLKKIEGPALFVYALRSTMVALDRMSLIRKMAFRASKGAIVICDRYPSRCAGAMDSSQFGDTFFENRRFSLTSVLARTESRIYKSIPAPDMVIKLRLPVETAVERNISRNKRGVESDEYVRLRHVQSHNHLFDSGHVYEMDTDKPLEETLLEVKRCVWSVL
ncbi:MAG: hypothetical protein JW919_02050 [Candidatus Omnitrophica bacterium]|nr:hypothetical protein [Candidatus Omnitrophota bacterium]